MPETGDTKDVCRLVKFSREESAAIHKVAKAHGRTITQLLSALQIIAYAESAINIAGKEGEERFSEVISSYETATHHNICLNAIDHVRLSLDILFWTCIDPRFI